MTKISPVSYERPLNELSRIFSEITLGSAMPKLSGMKVNSSSVVS